MGEAGESREGIAKQRSIIVAGSGRSGTTWVGSVLAACRGCIDVFEPLNRRRTPSVPVPADFPDFPGVYLRADGEHPDWEQWFWDLFRGRIENRWTRQDWQRELNAAARTLPQPLISRISRFRYRCSTATANVRIIKLIRGNLMLSWLVSRFDVPIVYVIRHPCAVVASRLRLGWEADLRGIDRQATLQDDYLRPFEQMIGQASSDAERMAVLWCVENLVAIRALSQANAWVCDYKTLQHEGEKAFKHLASQLRLAFTKRCVRAIAASHSNARSPDKNQLNSWYGLGRTEALSVLSICENFGLGMYGIENQPPDWGVAGLKPKDLLVFAE